jgi:glutaredoxin
MTTLTLYTRRACHLCDEMKAVVLEVVTRQPVELTEVDVDADPALARQYGHHVPVLFLDGREIARYRLTPTRLVAELRRRAGQPEV